MSIERKTNKRRGKKPVAQRAKWWQRRIKQNEKKERRSKRRIVPKLNTPKREARTKEETQQRSRTNEDR